MKSSVIKQATTGLAGAVAIASGSQAYGAVVSVAPPSNFIPTSGATAQNTISYDINNDGMADIDFVFQQTSTTGNFLSAVYGLSGLPVAYYGSYVVYANRLTAGTTINSSTGFAQTAGYLVALASRFSGTFYGQFVGATGTANRGFVGFSFTAADGVHFGAVDLSTSAYVSASNKGGLTFYGAEYQSVAGAPLTIVASVAVPEPTTLAALAFGAAGAAGVALRRRSKKASQPTA